MSEQPQPTLPKDLVNDLKKPAINPTNQPLTKTEPKVEQKNDVKQSDPLAEPIPSKTSPSKTPLSVSPNNKMASPKVDLDIDQDEYRFDNDDIDKRILYDF